MKLTRIYETILAYSDDKVLLSSSVEHWMFLLRSRNNFEEIEQKRIEVMNTVRSFTIEGGPVFTTKSKCYKITLDLELEVHSDVGSFVAQNGIVFLFKKNGYALYNKNELIKTYSFKSGHMIQLASGYLRHSRSQADEIDSYLIY